MVNLSEALQEALYRTYNIYVVGYIKNRRRKEKWIKKNHGAAEALASRYFSKYKSAYYYVMRPPGVMLKENYAAPNPLWERLNK